MNADELPVELYALEEVSTTEDDNAYEVATAESPQLMRMESSVSLHSRSSSSSSEDLPCYDAVEDVRFNTADFTIKVTFPNSDTEGQDGLAGEPPLDLAVSAAEWCAVVVWRLAETILVPHPQQVPE